MSSRWRVTTVVFFLLFITNVPWTTHGFVVGSKSGAGIVGTMTTRGPTTSTTIMAMDDQEDRRATAWRKIGQGMEAFRKGNITASIQFFNEAEQIQGPSLTPYLWQRGISYYYHDEFERASQQFRTDVRVNPNDVEEIVWDISSQLRAGTPFPVPNQLALPPGARDRRRIMPIVYKLFRGEGSEQDLAMAGLSKGASVTDEFYSLFYLGLFAEVRGEPEKAQAYMKRAVQTEYANFMGRGDYMTACARIHCQLRGWT